MQEYLKAAAVVLVTVVLGMTLSKHNKDMTFVLSMCVCCMVLGLAMVYIQPILDFIAGLQELGQLDSATAKIMLKAVGIGLVAEIAALICADAGNAALGKALQILASVMVLWMAIPLMQALLDLVQTILGEI